MKIKHLLLVSLTLVSCSTAPLPAANYNLQNQLVETLQNSHLFKQEFEILRTLEAQPQLDKATLIQTSEGHLLHVPVQGMSDPKAVMVVLYASSGEVLDLSVITNLRQEGQSFQFKNINSEGIYEVQATIDQDLKVETTSLKVLRLFQPPKPLVLDLKPNIQLQGAAKPQCTASVPADLLRARNNAQAAIEMQNNVVGRAYQSYLTAVGLTAVACAVAGATGGGFGSTTVACAAALANQVRTRENWLNQSDILQSKYRSLQEANQNISDWKSNHATQKNCAWY